MRIVVDMGHKPDALVVVGATLRSAEEVKRFLDAVCAAAEELWPGGLDAAAAADEVPPEGSMN